MYVVEPLARQEHEIVHRAGTFCANRLTTSPLYRFDIRLVGFFRSIFCSGGLDHCLFLPLFFPLSKVICARALNNRSISGVYLHSLRGNEIGAPVALQLRSMRGDRRVTTSWAASAAIEQNPCTSSQPCCLHESNCSRVSTPSATTFRLRICPIAMMALVIEASSASTIISRIKDWSILILLTGKRLRYPNEE